MTGIMSFQKRKQWEGMFEDGIIVEGDRNDDQNDNDDDDNDNDNDDDNNDDDNDDDNDDNNNDNDNMAWKSISGKVLFSNIVDI